MTAVVLDMASRLGREWAPSETEEAFRSRLMVSAASAWLLALSRSGGWIHIPQLEETAARKLSLLFPQEEEQAVSTVRHVFSILKDNGFLLTKGEEVTACETRTLHLSDISMIRGGRLTKNCFFSGCCAFVQTNRGEKNNWTVRMDLPDPDTDYLSLLFERSMPEKQTTFALEYLSYDPAGFWMYDEKRPRGSGPVPAVARDLTGEDIRYIVSGQDVRRVPAALESDDLYRYAQFQYMRRRSPVLKPEYTKQLVTFSLPLELPAPEARFLRLISWQETSGQALTCSVHSLVWPVLEKRLKALGFEIA